MASVICSQNLPTPLIHLVQSRAVLRGDGDLLVGSRKVVDVVKVVRGVLGSVSRTNGSGDLGEVDVLPRDEDVSGTSVLEGFTAGARGVGVLAGGVNLDAEGLGERASGVERTLGAVVLRGAYVR